MTQCEKSEKSGDKTRQCTVSQERGIVCVCLLGRVGGVSSKGVKEKKKVCVWVWGGGSNSDRFMVLLKAQ